MVVCLWRVCVCCVYIYFVFGVMCVVSLGVSFCVFYICDLIGEWVCVKFL